MRKMKRIVGLWILLALLLYGCGIPNEPGDPQGTPAGTPEQTAVPSETPEPSEEPEPSETPSPDVTEPAVWAGLTMEDLYISPFERNENGWLAFADGMDYKDCFPGLVPGNIENYEEGATGDVITEINYVYDNPEDPHDAVWIRTRGEKERRIHWVSVTEYEGCFGPYGIKTGMDFNEVMAALGLVVPWEGPDEEELFHSGVIVRSDSGADREMLPPKVTVDRDRNSFMTTVNLICPAQPYPADMDPYEYLFAEHYVISLAFSGSAGILFSWGWSIGAFGE